MVQGLWRNNVNEEGSRTPGLRRSLACAAVMALPAIMSFGCETDSFFDPSVTGRWEQTPTVVPVLERIDLIERDQGDFVEMTPIQPGDLVPDVRDYEVGPGDQMTLEILDFIEPNVPSQLQRVVGPRGRINLPQIGQINVQGLTAEDIRLRLREVLQEKGILQDAIVSVEIISQRKSTFTVFGAVSGVGRYVIPGPDYRILDALTEAGGISPAIKKVFVIRQVPLTEAASGEAGAAPAPKPHRAEEDSNATPGEKGTKLLDLIDDLTGTDDQESDIENDDGDDISPGLIGLVTNDASSGFTRSRKSAGQPMQPPPIDLVEEEPDETPVSDASAPLATPKGASVGIGRWMFLNGEWVRVMRQGGKTALELPEGPDALASSQTAADLVTQRVIEVPTRPLMQGAAEYNIIVRPGDAIRVPAPEQGVVYVGGIGISRPGTYNLPQSGRLTLSKAVIAAGGFSPIAVPWRVDLTRMVADDRQATIRINLKAIYAGTQPDVFLKPDDVVNVGTTWWAQPLAVARNGFRTSYGFGFQLDRNFGNDVFGAPPSNIGGRR